MCPARFVCVRHGQSEDNVGPTLSAAVPGLALTRRGLEQAEEAAAALGSENVAHVYASPLRRARETAAVIAETLGAGVTVLDDLREFSLGVHEGRPKEEATPPVDEMFLRWLLDGHLDASLDGGETGREVVDRFAAVMADLADTHRGQTAVVVSHGGTLSIALTAMCANLAPVFVRDHPLPNCGRIVVEYDGDEWRALSWVGEDPQRRSQSA